MSPGIRPSWLVHVAAAPVLFALAHLTGVARAGDPATARSLLESARDAIEQKKLDTALSLLTKARAEDAELLEVAYWEALAQEKKGDIGASLRAYRAFRDAAQLKQARGGLGKDSEALLKKAVSRLGVLAPGEVEDARLRAALGTELLGLAKAREAKDRAGAVIALEALLRACPDHDEARHWLARLTLPPLRSGEIPPPDPLLGIATWHDMIRDTPFGDIKEWNYVEPGLVVEGSRAVGAAEPILISGDCALDLEFRLVEARDPEWEAGWSLLTRPEVLNFTFSQGRAVMLTGLEGTATVRVIEERKLPDLVPGGWHRLSLLVEGNKVQAWVDRQKPIVFTWDALGPKTQLGLTWARCKFELRTFRWARAR